MCNKNYDQMMYGSLDMVHDRQMDGQTDGQKKGHTGVGAPLKNSLTTNIDIPGYNIEQTPTISSRWISHIYITKIIIMRRPSLIYTNNKPSLISGTIYKHCSMQHFKFSNNFLKKLLNKISLENKRSLIVGDFNLNLIKYCIGKQPE